MLQKFILLIFLALHFNQLLSVNIDRYTVIDNVETKEQTDELSVIINIKFPKSIVNVGQALDYLMLRSSYKLSNNAVFNNFKLPNVHKKIGPISLKRAIKVLVGTDIYKLQINRVNRTIAIVQNANAIVVSPDEVSDILLEKIKVAIKNNTLKDALEKIMPNNWFIDIINVKDTDLETLTVSVIAESETREKVIKTIMEQINAEALFYPEIQQLVVTNLVKNKVIR